MKTTFLLFFLPTWLCAAVFLVLRPRFTSLPEERHTDIHASLGLSPCGCYRWHTPAKDSAILAETGYLLEGGFRSADDPELNRLGRILRTAPISALVLMAGPCSLLISDFLVSGDR